MAQWTWSALVRKASKPESVSFVGVAAEVAPPQSSANKASVATELCNGLGWTAEGQMQGVRRGRSVRGIGEKSGKIVPSLPAGRHWKEVPVFLQGIAAGEKGVSSRVGFSECDRATLRMVSWFTGSSACRVTILQ